MLRVTLFLHRYLGVAVGLVMTLWCVSGFVMMYQAYPETTGEERLAGLERLTFAAPPILDGVALADGDLISGFRLEMMAGHPMLRLTPADGPPAIFDLASGAKAQAIDAGQAEAIARAHGRMMGTPLTQTIAHDQWTVQLARRHHPIYRLSFSDPAATQIYVSSSTGEVIQDTTRRERILGWLGAVPHWLYPAALRQHPKAWTQVVIWSSVIGLFLTVTGVYVGVVRWLKAPKGRLSPFRGLWLWHHMGGLFFGLLTLTWTLSGLLSMNPWGLLEGDGSPAAEAYETPVPWGEAKAFIAGAPSLADGQTVRLEAAPVGGALMVLARAAEGAPRRLAASGERAPFDRAGLDAALVAAKAPVDKVDLLRREDAYYYGHHGKVDLPVWRVTLSDPPRTLVYIDATTGRIARVADRASRQYRWWQSGLHDMDFPILRARPVWDIAVILMLLGVTLSTATGTWLAWRRVKRDVGALVRRD